MLLIVLFRVLHSSFVRWNLAVRLTLLIDFLLAYQERAKVINFWVRKVGRVQIRSKNEEDVSHWCPCNHSQRSRHSAIDAAAVEVGYASRRALDGVAGRYSLDTRRGTVHPTDQRPTKPVPTGHSPVVGPNFSSGASVSSASYRQSMESTEPQFFAKRTFLQDGLFFLGSVGLLGMVVLLIAFHIV